MRIDGSTAERLSEALLDAFTPQRLDEMLYYRLSKDRNRISMAGNYESIVFDIIRAADAEGWLDRLIVAARQSRPAHAGLLLVAESRRLGVQSGGLESILNTRGAEIHPTWWRARLGVVEGQVCRVEAHTRSGARAMGTGFLVGPDLCMTSWHVVRDLFTGGLRPGDIRLRFDFKRDAAGDGPLQGTLCELAADWAVVSAPSSPYDGRPGQASALPAAGELDFAVLRVAGSPGSRPLGREAEPGAAGRGWIGAPSRTPPRPGDDIVVVQHLLGGPVQLRFGRLAEVNANGTRVRHTADTEQGSSGSPCFTLEWELVAVHQSGDPGRDTWHSPEYNVAVPAWPIHDLLVKEGLGEAVFPGPPQP